MVVRHFLLRIIKFALVVGVLYLFVTRVLADLPMVRDARHLVDVAVTARHKTPRQ
jgi:hypothetical protein